MKRFKAMIRIIIGVSGLLLMLWFILPSVHISFTYIYVTIASILILILVLLNDRKRFLYFICIYSPCILFVLLYLIVPYSLQVKQTLILLQELLIFTVPAVLITFFAELDNKYKINRHLYYASTFFIIACIVLVYIQTMRALAVDPTVCRLLAVGTYSEYRADEVQALRMDNVGGFGFSYAIGLIEIYTFYYTIKESGKKRIIFAVITIALLVFAVKSQYLTLLLLCIIVNLVISIRFVKSNISRALIIFFIIVIVFFSGPILSFLTQIINGEKLNEKVYAIEGLLEGYGYSSMRIDYISEALKYFSNHILLGQPNLINDYELSSVSSSIHSTQIKLLVDVGLIGTLIYNVFLFVLYNHVNKLIVRNGQNPEPFKMAFCFFWILSWLNPVFANFEIPFALFFVIPLISCLPNFKKHHHKYDARSMDMLKKEYGPDE